MADMTLSEELKWRGFLNQTTLTDLNELDTRKWTFYHGFDASADSQTVGNLAAMMLDKAFLRHGHKAVLLAGGATSLIGDPGGKDKERPLQDEGTIADNVRIAGQQLQQVFKEHPFTLVNNLDWYRDMPVLHFLRDIGKHFSMTPLVQRDYIATRMGEGGTGISYTEFSYTILQGYDFWYLYKHHGVQLQLSGADQWGNCLSGVDLIRRTEGVEAHVLTCPLIINKATGKKFGKTEDGAVWLDPKKTSPTQFYQFWINADDEGAESYLKVFTELDKPAVDAIMDKHRQSPKERHAQTRLAQEVTELVHGKPAAGVAEAVTNVLQGRTPIGDITSETLDITRQEIPAVKAGAGSELAQVLVDTGLAESKTEARRFISENAIAINGQKTAKESLEEADFQNGRLLLRRGKAFKDSALVELA
jgi:tyrosyl-tRNA synthetase